MDIDINLTESLKLFDGLYNLDDLGELNEEIHLCMLENENFVGFILFCFYYL
jgi:hypothetical protein